MCADSNIILITNDNEVADNLKPKLILLREIDNILTFNYFDAVTNIREICPEVVLLYCNEEKKDCLKLIKAIKKNENLKATSVLLIMKDYDKDFILSAFDEDITDYLTLRDSNAEILMRTIWCLKKKSLTNTVICQHEILEKIGIIDKETGIYTNEYSDKVFEVEFKNLEKFNTESILMLIAPSEECKAGLNPLLLAHAIKASTRKTDILAMGTANRFYLLLKQTKLKGAFCVLNKIKQVIGEAYSLVAGASVVRGYTFNELKPKLLNALVESENAKIDLAVVSEEERDDSADEWLDVINSAQKNFKLFKQAFTKKLDKVIAPVFFQMQKQYEEKLFKVKIEQSCDSNLSTFVLKGENQESELKITYPGFSKINIDVIHQGLDSPENRRISLNLTQLDEQKLTNILQVFIDEFKSANSQKIIESLGD